MNVAIYVRVSQHTRTKEHGYSIEEQERKLLNHFVR